MTAITLSHLWRNMAATKNLVALGGTASGSQIRKYPDREHGFSRHHNAIAGKAIDRSTVNFIQNKREVLRLARCKFIALHGKARPTEGYALSTRTKAVFMRDALRNLWESILGILTLTMAAGWFFLIIQFVAEDRLLLALFVFSLPGIILFFVWHKPSGKTSRPTQDQDNLNSAAVDPTAQQSNNQFLSSASADNQVSKMQQPLTEQTDLAPLVSTSSSPVQIPHAQKTRTEQTKSLPSHWLADVQYFTNSLGQPVGSHNREEWLKVRNLGITATDAMKLVKKNGELRKPLWAMIEQKSFQLPQSNFQSSAMQVGIERELEISQLISERYDIHPNGLLLVGGNRGHLATPDGIGPEGISEIKVSKFSLDHMLSHYYDQVQWQLHVTGADKSLFAVQNRESGEIRIRWIAPDQARIRRLVEVADFALGKIVEFRPHFLAENQSLQTRHFQK